ncbi:uncharacterized protein LTR77_007780 [Saxophila tyrrhenica]|uniref:Uncharacterized protein n=1 Tax=Saxophila tyrrhenica TaxID=1690608 RepID=A0AAV9P306_9PEZI|nr:hypothetical protein LTR77_007780 [Saxophila tyrrhenica]
MSAKRTLRRFNQGYRSDENGAARGVSTSTRGKAKNSRGANRGRSEQVVVDRAAINGGGGSTQRAESPDPWPRVAPGDGSRFEGHDMHMDQEDGPIPRVPPGAKDHRSVDDSYKAPVELREREVGIVW